MLILFCQNTLASDVLIIESYHSGYDWDKLYTSGIEDILTDSYSISKYEMDTKRLPKEKHEDSAASAFEYYENENPKAVILGDDNALKFLGPKLQKENIPLVYLGINNNPAKYIDYSPHITGVAERPLMKRLMFQMRHILNKRNAKILVLFDDGTTSHSSVNLSLNGQRNFKVGTVEVDVQLIENYETWQTVVKSSKKDGYDAVIVGLYHTLVDDKGEHVEAEDVLAWTSENTPVPPFCLWTFAVGENKTIGGLLVDGYNQGQLAAGLLKRMLNGERAIEPIVGDTGSWMFSKSQAKKWNLNIPDDLKKSITYVD